MKKIFISCLFLTLTGFAQTQPTTPATVVTFSTLKSAMKDMSSKLKAIAQKVNDPKLNAESEKLALDLVNSVTECKKFMPSTAGDQASKDLYLKMIDETIQMSKDLATAFHNNDNTKAISLLDQLSKEKKDGHNRF